MTVGENGRRLKALKNIMDEITMVYDLANPDRGLFLQFLNHRQGNKNVTNNSVGRIDYRDRYSGITSIGTELENKVFSRFVFQKRLTKPLLVIIFISGEVRSQKNPVLVQSKG